MTLLDFVNTLKTSNVKITVKDADSDGVIITFFSEGIGGVEGDVSARTVKRWEIIGASAVTVVLEAA